MKNKTEFKFLNRNVNDSEDSIYQKPKSYFIDGKFHTTIQKSFPDLERDKEIQKDILKFKRETKLMNLYENLKVCGFPIDKHIKCRKCKEEGLEPLIKIIHEKQSSCGIRYCKKPHCISSRYAITLTSLENTKYQMKNGYRRITDHTLGLHFSIGYKRGKIENIKQIKKQMDRQMNFFLQKLRKGNPCPKGHRKFKKWIYNEYKNNKGELIKTKKLMSFYKKLSKDGKFKDVFCFDPINLSGIKVFDLKYYFDTKEYLLHYHFCAFPLGDYIDFNVLQKVRKDMIKNSKSQKSWHLQFHLNPDRKDGCKSAKSILKYMTKRAIGIYGKSDKYKDEELNNKKIADIINDKGVYTLQDLMSVNEYFDNLYNSKIVTYFGKKLKKYIYNGILSMTNAECRFHGKLDPKDIIIERVIIIPTEKPPNLISSEKMLNEKPNIKIVNLRVSANWQELGQEYLKQFQEINEFLKQESKANNQNQKQKRFSRWLDIQEGIKPTFDLNDKLNLLAFDSC